MRKPKISIILVFILLSFPVFFLGCKVAYVYDLAPEKGMEGYIYTVNNYLSSLINKPLEYDVQNTYLGGIVALIILWLFWMAAFGIRKNYRFGEEHGSAHWGNQHDIKPFVDPEPDNNIILTATESLSMKDRMLVTATNDFNRNKNVLVCGSPGSGKTREYAKPNMMQMHSSYVATTPKGDLVRETGHMFEENNYKIRSFNLINPEDGCQYNFFKYIEDDQDVLKIVNNIIKNTTPDKPTTADPFWEKSEIAFLEALFSYLVFEAAPEDRNMETVMMMYNAAQVKEDDEDYVSALDVLFEELAEDKPDCFAVLQYDIFKKGAGKTAKSILISVGVRLSPFNIPKIKALMKNDELDLDKIGDEKTVLYVVISDTDSSLNFLAAIMYQQLFDVLIRKADRSENGMLNVPVRCILDEFPNMGLIPDFDKLIATIRSRRISATVIIQSMAQLKKLYEKSWEVITGCCDSFLFLGGNEQSTLEYLSKRIDQETVDVKNDSISKHAHNGGYSFSNQTTGRSLITAGEIGNLNRKYCIYILSGVPPFKSKKYDITIHKNYKLLSDYDKSFTFSFPEYWAKIQVNKVRYKT